MIYRGLYSYRQRVHVTTLFPNIFFSKLFQGKVWRVQVAHLHNAERALSSLWIGVSNCQQIFTKISFVIFDIVVTFHWFGTNWRTFFTNQNAEIVACISLFRKSRHKPNLKSTSKYGLSPDLGGKWRRSEDAQASYPGLSFRLPWFSPFRKRNERRVQGLD